MTRRRRDLLEGVELARRTRGDGTGRGRYRIATPYATQPQVGAGDVIVQSIAAAAGIEWMQVSRASTQSLDSGGAYVSWDTETADPERIGFMGYGTLATDEILLPLTAMYTVNVYARWGSYTGGETVTLEWTRDGTTHSYTFPGQDTWQEIHRSISLPLQRGDVLKLKVTQTSGSAQDLEEAEITLGAIERQVVTSTAGAPAAPTGLTAAPGDEQVALEWDDNSEPDVNGYHVYQATSASGPFTKIADGHATSDYTATGLTNGTDYYFKVRAVNTIGQESPDSATVSATPGLYIEGDYPYTASAYLNIDSVTGLEADKSGGTWTVTAEAGTSHRGTNLNISVQRVNTFAKAQADHSIDNDDGTFATAGFSSQPKTWIVTVDPGVWVREFNWWTGFAGTTSTKRLQWH